MKPPKLNRFKTRDNILYQVGRPPIQYQNKLEALTKHNSPTHPNGKTWVNWKEYHHARQCAKLILEGINSVTYMFNDPTLEKRLIHTLLKTAQLDPESPMGERKCWNGLDEPEMCTTLMDFPCNKNVSYLKYIEEGPAYIPEANEGRFRIEDIRPKFPKPYKEWNDYLAMSVSVLEISFELQDFIFKSSDTFLIDHDTRVADLTFQVPPPEYECHFFWFWMVHPVQIQGDLAQVYDAHNTVSMTLMLGV